ncbi:VOC family protein [Staphylococcus caeli]|uniref:VOC family protein n=1 Tax=Staphylococcus caeli TaxID=2201815 RepID=UPI003F57E298
MKEDVSFIIQSINHVTYSVSDIKTSIAFYKDILKAEILVEGSKQNSVFHIRWSVVRFKRRKNIPRNEIQYSYIHMAFTIDESEFDDWYQWLKDNDVYILEESNRDVRDKQSTYFTDSDGYELELHTGTL